MKSKIGHKPLPYKNLIYKGKTLMFFLNVLFNQTIYPIFAFLGS